MGLLSRLLRRNRAPRAVDDDDSVPDVGQRSWPAVTTPTAQRPEMPEPTPTTRPLDASGTTAGTRSYRQPGGTPSTQRLHNPTRPGR